MSATWKMTLTKVKIRLQRRRALKSSSPWKLSSITQKTSIRYCVNSILLPPSIEPSATGHIVEQIEITKKLIDQGLAYEVNGSVYFDVLKYNEHHNYGILSGRVVEELMESGRKLDSQDEKRNKVDFALWKKASPAHIMRWPSPWSEGFPGLAYRMYGDEYKISG